MNSNNSNIVGISRDELKRIQQVDREVCVLRRVNVGLEDAIRKLQAAETEYYASLTEIAQLRDEARKRRHDIYTAQMQIVLELVTERLEAKKVPARGPG